MRQLIFIETTDEALIEAATALLPPEETRPDNAAYFSAEIDSDAPLGMYTAAIAETLASTVDKVEYS